MSAGKIARNYATALCQVAIERQELEEVKGDMVMIATLLDQNPELHQALASPIVQKEKKKAILDAIIKDSVQHLTYTFLSLLIRSTRIVLLRETTHELIRLYKEHHGIIPVTFSTAAPVADDIRNRIVQRLSEDLNATVELIERVDERLIGGCLIQVGDRRYDGTLRARLDKIDRQFNINIYKKTF